MVARWLIDHGVPGGWRLWSILRDSGALNCVARYGYKTELGETALYAPLFRSESSWSKAEFADYSLEIIDRTLHHAAGFEGEFDFIDCGADIGIISAAIVKSAPGLHSLTAFEPNAEACHFLKMAANEWRVPARALQVGVGERAMRARLVAPAEGGDAHACFIEEDENGPIEIVRIDDIVAPSNRMVVIKLDVEGGEMAAIAGALALLRAAPAFVVIFEAHPDAAARTGIDPCDIIRYIRAIAPADAYIAEHADIDIDIDKAFFPQLSGLDNTICNIVCASK